MINEFIVYCRQEMEGHSGNRSMPHIIVSISTPGDREATFATNSFTLGVLRLSFYDLDDDALKVSEIKESCEARCFNGQQARQVLDFVNAHPTAQRFIVHCDAGLSRSPAVAAALSKILVGEDSSFFKRYHPNMRVYRTILEAHHAS